MKKLTSLFILLFMVGCLTTGDLPNPPERLDPPKIEAGIADSVNIIGKAVHKTKASATENEILATEIEKTSTDETIKRYSTKIAGNSTKQISNMDSASASLDNLMELNYQIHLMQQYLISVDDQYSEIIDQNEDLRDEVTELKGMLTDISLQTDKNFAIIMNIIMGVGGFGIVIGLGMIAWGLYSASGMVKTGMLFFGLGVATTATAYFMGSNPIVVLCFGGVCVIGVIIYLITLLYKHRGALEEVTESMETVKKHGWEQGKKKIKHSNFTKELVNEAKLKKDKIEKRIKKVVINDSLDS